MASKPYGELSLGKHTDYPDHYSPDLLTAIPRVLARQALGIEQGSLPFVGEDIWNAFELSWLNKKGVPQVATAEFRLPCDSTAIIESKSFKLYLNSLNQVAFDSSDAVARTLQQDLAACAGSDLSVILSASEDWSSKHFNLLPGQCLDNLDIETDCYLPDSQLLQLASSKQVDETFHSHLFRSLCPVTAQPDWASVWVAYRGPQIDPASLLKYWISFRQHQGFHEQCVEKIFVELLGVCEPVSLTVGAHFTRRGGLDINPVRSTEAMEYLNPRLFRQ